MEFVAIVSQNNLGRNYLLYPVSGVLIYCNVHLKSGILTADWRFARQFDPSCRDRMIRCAEVSRSCCGAHRRRAMSQSESIVTPTVSQNKRLWPVAALILFVVFTPALLAWAVSLLRP